MMREEYKKGGKSKRDPRLARAGVSGFNKPKRTPKHPKKSHIVVAKEGDKIKIPFLNQKVGSKIVFENVLFFDEGKKKKIGVEIE